MEKGLKDLNEKDLIKGSMLSQLHRIFGAREVDLRTYSPLTLAYIGDAVFEMMIRTLIVEKGQRAANTLHRHTTKIVCAQTQRSWLMRCTKVSRRTSRRYTGVAKIQNSTPLPRMPASLITARRRDLRRSAAIFF